MSCVAGALDTVHPWQGDGLDFDANRAGGMPSEKLRNAGFVDLRDAFLVVLICCELVAGFLSSELFHMGL